MAVWGWQREQEIAQAQRVTHVELRGERYARIPFGSEPGIRFARWFRDADWCPDCGTRRGKLHVPNCDIERCPVCGGRH